MRIWAFSPQHPGGGEEGDEEEAHFAEIHNPGMGLPQQFSGCDLETYGQHEDQHQAAGNGAAGGDDTRSK